LLSSAGREPVNSNHAVIDTDIHQNLDPQRVGEFLPEPWRTSFASGNAGVGHGSYWHPNGVLRSDAVAPDGTRIESKPENLAQYFFDVYDLEYGVLNDGTWLTGGLPPEPDYAAAL